MKNKKKMLWVLMFLILVFGITFIGARPYEVLAINTVSAVSATNVNSWHANIQTQIDQIMKMIRSLIAQLALINNSSKTTNITPVITAICEYAAPPINCRYKQGPNFNSTNQCGLVLDCSSNTKLNLKVTSPNGGENWVRGSKQKITWEGSEPVNIELLFPRPSCLDAVPRCMVAERAPIRIISGVSGGVYEWTVNDSVNTNTNGVSLSSTISQYKMGITSSSQHDESDNLFTISTETNSKIICPQMMCAAPPVGMCYQVDPNNSCGCGTLTTSCQRDI